MYITYAHKNAPTGHRFQQLASDPVPAWAVDVKAVVEPTDDELRAAFMLVANKKDWKKPVNATIKNCNGEQVALIEKAIMFSTGSVPFSRRRGDDVEFYADGYYAAEAEAMGGCY